MCILEIGFKCVLISVKTFLAGLRRLLSRYGVILLES